LQIPLRSGHPCFWLTVPTAKPVVDFHHQVIAHAERTKNFDAYKKASKLLSASMLLLSFK
ncbi:hypothetical protein, partial [Tetragenococcus halophilus]|uniref:hypothetical protein n=1 Tax=Tetragenococcus halophilus TaxID=51669 RepID=UPI001F367BD3